MNRDLDTLNPNVKVGSIQRFGTAALALPILRGRIGTIYGPRTGKNCGFELCAKFGSKVGFRGAPTERYTFFSFRDSTKLMYLYDLFKQEIFFFWRAFCLVTPHDTLNCTKAEINTQRTGYE